MRKMHKNSTWNGLSLEQLETMEFWLFELNLGYEETLKRVRTEFGIEASIASLGRYYRRRAWIRLQCEMGLAQVAALQVNDLKTDIGSFRDAALRTVGHAIMKTAAEHPNQLSQMTSLVRLLLQNDHNEIERSRLNLAERGFDYKANAASIKDLPHIRAYLLAINQNDALSDDEKTLRIRDLLFKNTKPNTGNPEPPKPQLDPNLR